MVLCAFFLTALPPPACRNPGSSTPKQQVRGLGTFSLGTHPSPSQKGEDPRATASHWCWFPSSSLSRGVPLRVGSKKLKTYIPNFVGVLNSFSHQRRGQRVSNGVLWVQLMMFSLRLDPAADDLFFGSWWSFSSATNVLFPVTYFLAGAFSILLSPSYLTRNTMYCHVSHQFFLHPFFLPTVVGNHLPFLRTQIVPQESDPIGPQSVQVLGQRWMVRVKRIFTPAVVCPGYDPLVLVLLRDDP